MNRPTGPGIKIPQASRWAVFISGRGSNLQALLDQQLDVALVVTNKPLAPGVFKARRFGIPVYVLGADWSQLQQELCRCQISQILLLGFMKIVPESFIQLWKGSIFNLHPSLLPEFKGLKAFERSIKEKFDLGCSYHEVTAELDSGKVILQKSFFDRKLWDQPAPAIHRLQWGLSLSEHQLTREGYLRCRW